MCTGQAGRPPFRASPSRAPGSVRRGLRPLFLTEADLNGDGRPDYVTDLAGLDCVNAWSYFCGSAGCPVTVWLSGPDGLSVGWSGHAQAWELRGTEVLLYLHGEMCTPPRPGVEGCEEALRFDAPAAESAAERGPRSAGRARLLPAPTPAPGAAPRLSDGRRACPGRGPAARRDRCTKLPPPRRPRPTLLSRAPADPAVMAEDAPGWTSARLPDETGWFARVEDPESGARIDWICAKGRESRFALTPAPEGGTITIDVDGRTQDFAVTAEGGTAYAPVAIGSPLFLHIASGQGFRVLDAAGAPVARFSMRDAPSAIGQAEGRCQF